MQKMRNPFIKILIKIRDAKMQTKLIVSFLLLAVIPPIVIGGVYVSRFKSAIEEKISIYSLQLVKQVGENIESNIFKIKSYSDDILISVDFNNRIHKYTQASDTEKTISRDYFSQILQFKFLNIKNIDDMLIAFVNEDSPVGYDTIGVAGYYRWEKEDLERIIAHNASKGNEKNFMTSLVHIRGAEESSIIIGRKIMNVLTSKELGHIFIALNQDFLRSIYEDIEIGKGADVFILDKNGIVLSSNNPNSMKGNFVFEKDLIERITQNKVSNKTFSLKIDDEMNLVAYSKLEELDWYIVSTIPFAYLNSETSSFIYSLVTFTTGILFLAILVSFLLSHSISSPIKRLEKHMERFGEGSLGYRIEVDRDDEIGHLQKSFNYMADDIERLLLKIEDENKLRRITELKVLEYQINPHFLYNTLDAINWMAQKARQYDIGDIVTALARFFRLSLNNGKEYYALKDEIEHVLNYLIISKIRYKDCFDFTIQVDPEAEQCKTLKIVLQPIVENAIKHGIYKNKNEGHIWIIGEIDEEGITLMIRDNGKGMDKDRLEELNKSVVDMKDLSCEGSGFGLRNVQQRIRLNYGEKYGLLIESQLGIGTNVVVKLPKNA